MPSRIQPYAPPAGARILAFGLAAFGSGLLWVSTFRHGLGLSYDTAQYFFCAESLIRGDGLTVLGGESFSLYPPLHVLLLVPGILAGGEVAHVARLLNILCHAGTVFIAFVFLSHVISDRRLLLTTGIIVAVGYPLLWIGSWALADCPFVFLVTLGLFCTFRLADENPRFAYLLLASTIWGLATIQRYAGAPLLALPIVAIALNRRRMPRPFAWAALSSVLSTIPLGLWMLYRAEPSGSLINHAASRTPWTAALDTSCFTLTFWLNRPYGWLLLAGVFVAVVVIRYGREMGRTMTFAQRSALVLCAVFFVLYSGFLIGVSSLVHIETPRDRYLAPLFIPIVALIVIPLDVCSRLDSRYIRNAALFIFVLFALGQYHLSGRRVMEGLTLDAGGATYLPSRPHRDYSRVRFAESAVAAAAKQSYESGAIVLSNVPQALYLTAGVETEPYEALSLDAKSPVRVPGKAPHDPPVYFVWVYNAAASSTPWSRILRQGSFKPVLQDAFAVLYAQEPLQKPMPDAPSLAASEPVGPQATKSYR